MKIHPSFHHAQPSSSFRFVAIQYEEYFSMSMGQDFKITVLVNTLNDDFEPVWKMFR